MTIPKISEERVKKNGLPLLPTKVGDQSASLKMICSFLDRGIAFICASRIKALERVRPSIRLRGYPILLWSRGRTVLKGDESILSHADGVIEGLALPERSEIIGYLS